MKDYSTLSLKVVTADIQENIKNLEENRAEDIASLTSIMQEIESQFYNFATSVSEGRTDIASTYVSIPADLSTCVIQALSEIKVDVSPILGIIANPVANASSSLRLYSFPVETNGYASPSRSKTKSLHPPGFTPERHTKSPPPTPVLAVLPPPTAPSSVSTISSLRATTKTNHQQQPTISVPSASISSFR